MMVTTIHGEMDDSLLEKREGRNVVEHERFDDVNYAAGVVRVPYILHETADWIEYYLDGELVHRSAHLTLLPLPAAKAEVNSF
jgi:hypothetical protein